MHFTGLTIRPPYEGRSILLQVTTGCSHNRCTFCSLYRDVKFGASPFEEIEEDLREIATYYVGRSRRIFLCSGDAFTLPASRLEKIAELIYHYLPSIQSIGCYASIANIQKKTDEELRRLAKLGFSDLNIGLESTLDDVLSFMNKGYTIAEARTQLLRLREAGVSFNVNIINGIAGPSRMHEHAKANAEFLNEIKPTLIFVSPLHIDPGTPLEKIAQEGGFQECSLGEYVSEEIELVEGLDLEDCYFFGSHISNPVSISGHLPGEKDKIINALHKGMQEYTQEELDSHPRKGPEGRIIG